MAYESYAREAREPHTPVGRSPVSLSVFSLVPDLLVDCSRVAGAYLNTQKYGLFCSLPSSRFVVETEWFLNPVSFKNAECACPVETVRWKCLNAHCYLCLTWLKRYCFLRKRQSMSDRKHVGGRQKCLSFLSCNS